MSYAVVKNAILERVSLTARYEDYLRFFSPHAIGTTSDGSLVVVAYQYGGGKPGGGFGVAEWCRFYLHRLHDVRPNGDGWRDGPLDADPREGLSQIVLSASPSSSNKNSPSAA